MRRSSYQQIIDWNERRGDQYRPGMDLVGQIDDLRVEVEAISGIAPLHIQFVPIRLVTILEVFLREVIAELVDGEQVAFEKVEKLVKGAKIDLAFAAHVNRRELTIGDLVAHSVSLNGVEGVFNIMTTLIDGFPGKIAIAHPRWSEEANEWPLPAIITDYDATLATLGRLFEIRHILTHELPSESALDPKELPIFIEAAQSFIKATDWTVVESLHGSVPRTQISMNMLAEEDLDVHQTKLDSTLSRVEALPGIDCDALRQAHAAWADFAEKQASVVASQVEGGSMYPLLWASEKAALVRDRITQLNGIIDRWME